MDKAPSYYLSWDCTHTSHVGTPLSGFSGLRVGLMSKSWAPLPWDDKGRTILSHTAHRRQTYNKGGMCVSTESTLCCGLGS